MLNLADLSKLGFGCHLVSSQVPQHYDALVRALRAGCNLFDTSANYMNGESEKLVGTVLQDNPQYDSFVITKSGYDEREALDAALIRDLLHPDFLRTRLELSSNRLQRQTIDCFLLHSPETCLSPPGEIVTQQDFYAKIKQAFEFLETQVVQQKIRYFGISSNTFHLPTDSPETINLHKVLAIAGDVSDANHFKFIEFPFNLVEQQALIRHHAGTSLIELAHSNNLITVGNRPLNAKAAVGALRLALYDEVKPLPADGDEERSFRACVALIERQLKSQGLVDDPMDFAIVKYLKDNWSKIGNPDAVHELFEHYFHPLLHQVYRQAVPADDLEIYRTFYLDALAHARKVMTGRTLAFRREMTQQGILQLDDDRPLPLVACEFYLRAGIDHVLVGMRKPEYVEMLKSLF